MDNCQDWRRTLQNELEAKGGSFIIQLQGGSGWNDEAFMRLFDAMKQCCKTLEGAETLERWIVEVFHQVSVTTQSLMQHENDFYSNRATNVDDLIFG